MQPLLIDFPRRRALLFVAFFLLYEVSVYISNDMIMPGMIAVVKEFSAPITAVGSALTLFIFGGVSLQLFLGPLSDRIGRRAVMLGGVVLFLLATLAVGFSPSISFFLCLRFMQGMGLCFIGVIGYAVLQECFTELDAVRLISVMGNITVLAPLAGPLLGAIVIHLSNWRMIFFIVAAFTMVALIGIWRFMPETVGVKRRDGSELSVSEFRLKPILRNYHSLIKNKRFILGSAAVGAASVPIIAWIGTSPLILMQKEHFSVIHYALLQLPVFIAASMGNIKMRRSTYRMPLERIILIGSCILLFGLALLAILPIVLHKSYVGILIGTSCYAFGLGFTMGPLNRLTLFSTALSKGTASALMNILMMLFTGLGSLFISLIYLSLNNVYFGLFCGSFGLIYLGFYYSLTRLHRKLPS